MRNFRLLVTFALAATLLTARDGKWISLIQQSTLDGWQTEGNAAWSVDKGTMVGRQGPGGSAGDIFTKQRWTDFELEAEWKMHWPGNSGIWFKWSGGKTGMQADFLDEPASYPNVYSGSLYCMGKAFIAKNSDTASVNHDGWNRIRIVVRGEHIVIEQNGRKVVDVRESSFPGPGSIGIQAHAGKAFADMEIRVRKLRIRELAQQENKP